GERRPAGHSLATAARTHPADKPPQRHSEPGEVGSNGLFSFNRRPAGPPPRSGKNRPGRPPTAYFVTSMLSKNALTSSGFGGPPSDPTIAITPLLPTTAIRTTSCPVPPSGFLPLPLSLPLSFDFGSGAS